MKIRTCFVSNSSTSSFIILDLMTKDALVRIFKDMSEKIYNKYFDPDYIKILEIGSDEFEKNYLWWFYDGHSLPQDISFEEYSKSRWMYKYTDPTSTFYTAEDAKFYTDELKEEYAKRVEDIKKYNALKGYLFVVGGDNDSDFMEFIDSRQFKKYECLLLDENYEPVTCGLDSEYVHLG